MRSYERLRDRTTRVAIDREELLVATLADIIKSKRAAGRTRDRAVLDVLERAHETARRRRPQRALAALAKESERADAEMIRRWQALPMENRTHFLRKRIGLRGSAL